MLACVSVWQDFVSAVMDVDYSPTGREFVAGSYDRSVRIFGYNAGHSREVSEQEGPEVAGTPTQIHICCAAAQHSCVALPRFTIPPAQLCWL